MVSCTPCLLWAIGYIIGGFIALLFGIYIILQIPHIQANLPRDSNTEKSTIDKESENFKPQKPIWKIILFVLIGIAAILVGIDLCLGWHRESDKYLRLECGVNQSSLNGVIRSFGEKSEIYRNVINVFHSSLLKPKSGNISLQKSIETWRQNFTQLYGNAVQKPRMLTNLHTIAKEINIELISTQEDLLIFALQTYYALIIKSISFIYCIYISQEKTVSKPNDVQNLSNLKKIFSEIEAGILYHNYFHLKDMIDDESFAWYLTIWNSSIETMLQTIIHQISGEIITELFTNISITADFFIDLYHAIIPASMRHDLGEFFTPSWLASLAVSESGYVVDPNVRVLDPGCGSGTFLCMILMLLRNKYDSKRALSIYLRNIFSNIVGFEINPVARLTAKLNYLIHIGDLLKCVHDSQDEWQIPIFPKDIIFSNETYNPNSHLFDIILGNPPWIKWEFLSSTYKSHVIEACLPIYPIFSVKGMKSRLGFAHDDISILYTYICIHRYLKSEGTLSFLLKQTLFHNVAGKDFRKFCIETPQICIPFKIQKVHDLVQRNPFQLSGAETALVIIKKGQETTYPVPYFRWTAENIAQQMDASPDPRNADPTNPWLTTNRGQVLPQSKKEGNNYMVRHGVVNDLNNVFFVDILDVKDGLVQIQNRSRGKKKISPKTMWIEPDLLYPVVKPRHIEPYRIKGYYYMLVPQKKHGENNLEQLKQQFPRTYEYLDSFRSELLSRSSIWFKGKNKPFYSLFGIGDYTFYSYKIIWSSIGYLPKFALVSQINDKFIGSKVIIPDNTIGYIATESVDEAYFLCALLNSVTVKKWIQLHSNKSKWGLSIGLIKQIALPLYNKTLPLHAELVDLAINISKALSDQKNFSVLEQRIDEISQILLVD